MYLSEELHAILAGFVGGLRYGFKIRLPHALVMTALFRRDLTSEQKIATIWKLAREHATNLAAFAAMYKTVLALLKLASRRLHLPYDSNKQSFLQSLGRTIASVIVEGPYGGNRLVERDPGRPERYHHALVAGAVGGYFIWGKYSNVNHQIVLYLASRVLVSLGKKAAEALHISHHSTSESYPLFAAAIWGTVMMLFEETPHLLHSSLKKSMDEIYRYEMTGSKRENGVKTNSVAESYLSKCI